jgi:hypothetical protein
MISWFGDNSKTFSYRLTIMLCRTSSSSSVIRARHYYHWNGSYSSDGEFDQNYGDVAEFMFVMTSGNSGYWQSLPRIY